MQRLTRLTALLTLLQGKRIHTADALARRFEVSVRTIYRDIATLQEAGVPIGGEAGMGYYLVEGYSLAPIAFTEQQANALVTAGALVRQQPDGSLTQHYLEALDKVKAVLKAAQKEQVDALESRQGPSVPRVMNPTSHWLSALQAAITRRQQVQLKYVSAQGAVSQRAVEPVGLYFTTTHWLLIGYCHLRQALREFRLDRMEQVTPLETTFAPRDFDLERYFKQQG